jgi:hypothetical protein
MYFVYLYFYIFIYTTVFVSLNVTQFSVFT